MNNLKMNMAAVRQIYSRVGGWFCFLRNKSTSLQQPEAHWAGPTMWLWLGVLLSSVQYWLSERFDGFQTVR